MTPSSSHGQSPPSDGMDFEIGNPLDCLPIDVFKPLSTDALFSSSWPTFAYHLQQALPPNEPHEMIEHGSSRSQSWHHVLDMMIQFMDSHQPEHLEILLEFSSYLTAHPDYSSEFNTASLWCDLVERWHDIRHPKDRSLSDSSFIQWISPLIHALQQEPDGLSSFDLSEMMWQRRKSIRQSTEARDMPYEENYQWALWGNQVQEFFWAHTVSHLDIESQLSPQDDARCRWYPHPSLRQCLHEISKHPSFSPLVYFHFTPHDLAASHMSWLQSWNHSLEGRYLPSFSFEHLPHDIPDYFLYAQSTSFNPMPLEIPSSGQRMPPDLFLVMPSDLVGMDQYLSSLSFSKPSHPAPGSKTSLFLTDESQQNTLMAPLKRHTFTDPLLSQLAIDYDIAMIHGFLQSESSLHSKNPPLLRNRFWMWFLILNEHQAFTSMTPEEAQHCWVDLSNVGFLTDNLLFYSFNYRVAHLTMELLRHDRVDPLARQWLGAFVHDLVHHPVFESLLTHSSNPDELKNWTQHFLSMHHYDQWNPALESPLISESKPKRL